MTQAKQFKVAEKEEKAQLVQFQNHAFSMIAYQKCLAGAKKDDIHILVTL